MSYQTDAVQARQVSQLSVALTLLSTSTPSESATKKSEAGKPADASTFGPATIVSISSSLAPEVDTNPFAAFDSPEVAALSRVNDPANFRANVAAYAKAYFDTLDTTGKGYVTQADFEQFNVEAKLADGQFTVDQAGYNSLKQKADAQFAQIDTSGSGKVTLEQFTRYFASTLNSLSLYYAIGDLQGTSSGQYLGSDAADILINGGDLFGHLYGNSQSVQYAEQAFQYQVKTAVSTAFSLLDPTGTGQVTKDQFVAAAKAGVATGDTYTDSVYSSTTNLPHTTFEQLFDKISGGKSSFTQADLTNYDRYNWDAVGGVGLLGF